MSRQPFNFVLTDPMSFIQEMVMHPDWKNLSLVELVQKLRSLDQITQGELKKLDALFPMVMQAGVPEKAFKITELEEVIRMGERYLGPNIRDRGLLSEPEARQSDGRK